MVCVEAVPPVTVTGLPIGVAPFWNCTLPTAAVGVSVAVSVSWVPAVTGEGGHLTTAAVERTVERMTRALDMLRISDTNAKQYDAIDRYC